MTGKRKILLIGLDSATWQVINPLLETGQLPHLKNLTERGVHGVLQSVEYSASPVVWTTLATGKLPEKHGIQDFFAPQAQLRATRIWEILARQGKAVGIYQFLVTWPPRPLNGFVIPGWLAASNATHPPDLQFIKAMRENEKRGENRWRDYFNLGVKALSHGLRPSTLVKAASYRLDRRRYHNTLDDRWRAHRVDIALNTDFFCTLLQRNHLDFAAVIYYQADAAGHFYWKYHEPEAFSRVSAEEVARYGQVIPTIYRDLDAAVGRILNAADDDYTIFVVSDHGMAAATHPSTFLYRPRLADFLEKQGYYTDQGHALIGLDFYINLHDQDQHARAPDFLLDLLNNIVIEQTGEAVFEARLHGKQYVVVRVRTARPELRDALVRLPTGQTYSYSDLVSMSEKTSGTHHPEGILIAAGLGIQRGCQIHGAALADVTPTMLALLGMPVARDMDGRVLEEMIEPGFLAENPVQFIDTYENDLDNSAAGAASQPLSTEEIGYLEDRLRALGYIE